MNTRRILYFINRINFMKRGKYLKLNDIISELKCTEGENSIYNVSSSFFLSFLYIYKFTYLHIKILHIEFIHLIRRFGLSRLKGF